MLKSLIITKSQSSRGEVDLAKLLLDGLFNFHDFLTMWNLGSGNGCQRQAKSKSEEFHFCSALMFSIQNAHYKWPMQCWEQIF